MDGFDYYCCQNVDERETRLQQNRGVDLALGFGNRPPLSALVRAACCTTINF